MTTPGDRMRPDNLPEIPDYEILGELGRGGMGIVYKARQISRDRLVALKMILSGRGAGYFDVARFQIEAEAVACLQHPNIIRIHQVGLYRGCPYVALEFAEGGSLASKLPEQTRLPRWSAEIVRDLARAMQLAHDRGILHRDLKPANILLMADGTPKITDFGLAKFERPMQEVSHEHCTIMPAPLNSELAQFLRDFQKWNVDGTRSLKEYMIERSLEEVMGSVPGQEGPERSMRKECVSEVFSKLADLTLPGTIMGSPPYMAPEQARGDNRRIGPATDIYALGAVLYHLLTGRPPFQGTDLSQVLEQVQTTPPSPIHPKVNRELEAICLTCLEKRAEDRYPGAGVLADDLQRFLDGYAVHARTERPEQDLSRSTAVEEPPEDLPTQNPSPSQADLYRTKSWWQFWK